MQLSVKIGHTEHVIGNIYGGTVDLTNPEQAELVGMMVKDWAEGLLDREAP